MIVCAPVNLSSENQSTIDPRWGRAHWVALAEVVAGNIQSWREIEVSWDLLHDEGTDGSHHARIAKFLKANVVELVVVDHMGDGMVRMLGTMNIPVSYNASGDARAAISDAISLTGL